MWALIECISNLPSQIILRDSKEEIVQLYRNLGDEMELSKPLPVELFDFHEVKEGEWSMSFMEAKDGLYKGPEREPTQEEQDRISEALSRFEGKPE